MRQDLERELGDLWTRVKSIENSDADLSARQEEVLERVVMSLSKDRLPQPELKKELLVIWTNLAELCAND